MNVITGLPRSGSTLLCNILNQNSKNYASDTSTLAGIVQAISNGLSNQLEAQNVDHARVIEATKAFISTWYDVDKTIYDKGRLWSSMGLIYQSLELGKMFVLVRDLRDVYASMEKHHRKNPMLAAPNIISSTGVFQRADMAFSPEGMIGSCVAGIEDLIRRDLPNVVFVQYEAMCADPQKVLSSFDDFEYDFDNVKNVSEELDKAYHDKYPHHGDGKVSTKSIGMWKEFIDNDLAENIKAKFPLYNKTFGY